MSTESSAIPSGVSPDVTPEEYTAAANEPRIAIASVPPNCRPALFTADAFPARSTGTDAIAVSVVAGMCIAPPIPRKAKPSPIIQ